ncbi:hypothetical protein EV702DRAFT_1199850 [Suillus placidus]|uniref:GST N-terminal domain-containing protein n=1 Tax=Suillus placidus TaxID=48579 RepID=A0A9P6ZSG2_9AGAM|nr:hypothetical protein EV702DRAFT_1199850 [Suillus placidus]
MVSFFPPPPCEHVTSSLSADKNCILECSKGTVESLALEGSCEGVRKDTVCYIHPYFIDGASISEAVKIPAVSSQHCHPQLPTLPFAKTEFYYAPGRWCKTYTVPVLSDPNTGALITDSLEIASYLEKTYPEKPIFPNNSEPLIRVFDSYHVSLIRPAIKSIYTCSTEILSPTSAKFFIGLLIGVAASRPFRSTSATTPASASTSSAAASANVIRIGTAGIASAAVAALLSSISSPSFSSSSSSLLLLSSVVVEPGSNANRTSRTRSVTFGPGFGQMAEPEPVVRFGVRKIRLKHWTEPDFGSTTRHRLSPSSTRAFLCLGSWLRCDLVAPEDLTKIMKSLKKRKRLQLCDTRWLTSRAGKLSRSSSPLESCR